VRALTLKHHKNADNANHQRYEVWHWIFCVKGFFMKKTITWALVAVLGVGVLGAVGAWFVASGNAVSHAEQFIAQLNAKVLPQNGTVKLTYDHMARSRFPAVGITLTNPMLTSTIPADAQGRPPIDIVWKRGGHVDILTDYLKNEYRVISDGAGTLNVTSGLENVTTTTDSARIELSIAARDRAAFAQWNTLDFNDNAAVRQSIKNLAAFTLSISPMVMKDADSNAVIYTQDASSIKLANRTVDGTIDFDLDLALNGIELTTAYGLVARRILRAVQMPEGAWNEQMPFSSTRAGKQDILIAMQVNIPDKPSATSNGFIHVPVLRVKNNFYTVEMPLHVVLKEENNLRLALLKLNASLQVAPAAALEMQAALATLGTEQGMGGVLTQMVGATNTAINQEALKQKLTEALPTLSTLGPITLDVDIEAALPAPNAAETLTRKRAPDALAENLTIRALRLNNARWGLDVKGMAARTSGTAPTIDMTVTCLRCDTMTKDIYDTAFSAQQALNLMNPERVQWPVNEALLANITTALAQIGRKDAEGDITFGISSPTAGDYRINDTPFQEILSTLMTIFAPLPEAEKTPAPRIPATPLAPIN